jgi:hypothetical protein
MGNYLKLETWKTWVFCFLNIPLLFFVRPRIMEISDQRAVIVIRLNRRTRNHVRSMYFAALCAGADLVPGLIALRLIGKQNDKIVFVFKDFYADFLQRCEGDVYFTFEEGELIAAAIERTKNTGERQNVTLNVTATVPSKLGSEPAAKFKLTLSLKKR